MKRIKIHDLGRISYLEALKIQENLVGEVIDGSDTAHMLLLEHFPPVITLGRRAKSEHLLLDRARLEKKGFQLFESSRGGDVTYHGPGQLIAYPVVRLDGKNSVRKHMRNLEQSVIDLLGDMDIEGMRKEGFPGVWTSKGKISSVGVAVKKWVTYHGLSLNVEPDTGGFDTIIPCGLKEISVTSLSAMAGRNVTAGEILPRLAEHLREALGFSSDKAEFVSP